MFAGFLNFVHWFADVDVADLVFTKWSSDPYITIPLNLHTDMRVIRYHVLVHVEKEKEQAADADNYCRWTVVNC